jgi:hypothetical protein
MMSRSAELTVYDSDELSAISHQLHTPPALYRWGRNGGELIWAKQTGNESFQRKSNRKQRKKGKNKRKQMAAMSCQRLAF